MSRRIFYNVLLLSMGVFLWGCNTSAGSGESGSKGEPVIVFLVRHAEKVDQSIDPDLSEQGYVRAGDLARTLANASIEQVHSSGFIRTKETARPLASMLGLEIDLYNPKDLYALAEQLEAAGGRHLVVGHSNTTPALVEILGGDPGSPIEEKNEYDRLYILTIVGSEVNTVLMRYGKPCSSLPSKISASSLVVPQISGSALN